MEKEFNVTGTCIPEMHYMVDTSNKLEKIIRLIEKGKYFVINRPRQYGKTTTLFLLNKVLNAKEEYLSIKISFESISSESCETEESFLKAVLIQLKKYFKFSMNTSMHGFMENNEKILKN